MKKYFYAYETENGKKGSWLWATNLDEPVLVLEAIVDSLVQEHGCDVCITAFNKVG